MIDKARLNKLDMTNAVRAVKTQLMQCSDAMETCSVRTCIVQKSA